MEHGSAVREASLAKQAEQVRCLVSHAVEFRAANAAQVFPPGPPRFGGKFGSQFRKRSTRPKGLGVRGLKEPFTPLAAGHGTWLGGSGSFIGKAGGTSEIGFRI